MGYGIHLTETSFRIKSKDALTAFAVVRDGLLGQLKKEQKIYDKKGEGTFLSSHGTKGIIAGGGHSEGRRWIPCYSWVRTEMIERAVTLVEILEEFRYVPVTNKTGDITAVEFDGEKIGDEGFLFQLLAPYVQDGSYIQMMGEDDYTWRWVFTKGKVHEVSPKTVWLDPSVSKKLTDEDVAKALHMYALVER